MDALYDCKSEVIGPGFFRFKAEIGDYPAISYPFLSFNVLLFNLHFVIFTNVSNIHSVEVSGVLKG